MFARWRRPIFELAVAARALFTVALATVTALPAAAQPMGVLAAQGSLVVEPMASNWCGEYVQLRLSDRSDAPLRPEAPTAIRVMATARFAVLDHCPHARVIEIYAKLGDRFTRVGRAEQSDNWALRLTRLTQMAEGPSKHKPSPQPDMPRGQQGNRDSRVQIQQPEASPLPAAPPSAASPSQTVTGNSGIWIDVLLIIGMVILALVIARVTGFWRILAEIAYEVLKAIFSDRNRA